MLIALFATHIIYIVKSLTAERRHDLALRKQEILLASTIYAGEAKENRKEWHRSDFLDLVLQSLIIGFVLSFTHLESSGWKIIALYTCLVMITIGCLKAIFFNIGMALSVKQKWYYLSPEGTDGIAVKLTKGRTYFYHIFFLLIYLVCTFFILKKFGHV
jgi:hypothetical protein